VNKRQAHTHERYSGNLELTGDVIITDMMPDGAIKGYIGHAALMGGRDTTRKHVTC